MAKIDFEKLYELHKLFPYSDMPFLQEMIRDIKRTPNQYQNLKILHNTHITWTTLCKLEPFFYSSATLVVTASPEQNIDEEALEHLKKMGIKYVPFNDLEDDFDLVLDCCAGTLGKITPRMGVVELTQTGEKKYQRLSLPYPVISVDSSDLKKFETRYGTADGFIRALSVFITESIQDKHFIIFGYGKVGQGIAYALKNFTNNITIIDYDAQRCELAQENGYSSILMADQVSIQHALHTAFCVVTATGVKNLLSHYFQRKDFQHVAHFANMGSEDEFGTIFSKEEVYFDKKPLNFFLREPTKLVYLDPIFYAHNVALDYFVSGKITAGMHFLPAALDESVVKKFHKFHRAFINPGQIYFDLILDSLPGYLFWKDNDSVFLGCNKNFALAAGLKSHKEIIGKTDFELAWTREEAKYFREGDSAVLQGKPLINVEELQTHGDGEQKTILVNKTSLYHENKNLLGVIGMYLDITSTKQRKECPKLSPLSSTKKRA